jgi:hypothetical protein
MNTMSFKVRSGAQSHLCIDPYSLSPLTTSTMHHSFLHLILAPKSPPRFPFFSSLQHPQVQSSQCINNHSNVSGVFRDSFDYPQGSNRHHHDQTQQTLSRAPPSTFCDEISEAQSSIDVGKHPCRLSVLPLDKPTRKEALRIMFEGRRRVRFDATDISTLYLEAHNHIFDHIKNLTIPPEEILAFKPSENLWVK